jgi:hypothetical protein
MSKQTLENGVSFLNWQKHVSNFYEAKQALAINLQETQLTQAIYI